MYLQPFLLLVLLIISLHWLPTASQECSTSDEEALKNHPDTLCNLEITIDPQPDCSADIVEKMTFPHTIDGDIERDIACVFNSLYVGRLNISTGSVQPLDEQKNFDSYMFSFKTEASTKQITYELSYNLKKAVRVYDKPCNDDITDPDPEKKVIRWKPPQAWSPSVEIEKISIALNIQNQNETISDDVGEEGVYYRVFEWDCPAEPLQCCQTRQRTRTLEITFGVIIVVVVILFVLFCWIRRRRSASSNVVS